MNIKLTSITILGFLLFLYACKSDKLDENYLFVPEDIRNSLQEITGNQRDEVLRVIDHYAANTTDSLKLRAAYFLIKELPRQIFYTSSQLEKFDTLFSIIAAKPADWQESIPWYGNHINKIFDSLEKDYGKCCDVKIKHDKDFITADLLIENIDLAFASWNKPWARHYTFQQFCEYILPYRSSTEILEKWRAKYVKRFDTIVPQLKDSANVLELAKRVNDEAQLRFQTGINRYPVEISPSNLLKTSFADCKSIANHKVFAMRAMGIAIAVDYVPLWGNGFNGHYWNALFDTVGRPVNFMTALNDVQAQTAYNWILTKVYRRTYSANPEVSKLLNETDKQCPPFFYDPAYIDVTNEYVPVSEISVTLDQSTAGNVNKYVYLCQFNNGWTPVDFAEIKNGSATFDNLGRNACYHIMYFDKGKYYAAALPFILYSDGHVQKLLPEEDTKQKAVLTRKCHMEIRKDNWLRSLVGAEIHVSNDSSFKTYSIIHTIKGTPSQHLQKVNLKTTQPYRYARLKFSPEELKIKYWGDGASIAELAFFNSHGEKISGKPFGSNGRIFNDYTVENVFDDKPLTFFEDARDQGPKYVGLKFNEPTEIAALAYQPRNDLNCIQVGDTYELMYYSGKEFISLGEKVAKDTLLIYENSPRNAIFWLKNLSNGKEERIFTYENGKQIWW
jgi:hypothetical protein